jgi:hypothetical protein
MSRGEDMNKQEMVQAAAAKIALKIFKLSFDLMGFGAALAAVIMLIMHGVPEPWYLAPLAGLVAGYLVGHFAYRYTMGVFRLIVDIVVAAHRGTMLMAEKALDNWDCGDPSCEGCKAAREAREKAPSQARIGFHTGEGK